MDGPAFVAGTRAPKLNFGEEILQLEWGVFLNQYFVAMIHCAWTEVSRTTTAVLLYDYKVLRQNKFVQVSLVRLRPPGLSRLKSFVVMSSLIFLWFFFFLGHLPHPLPEK